MDTEAELIFVDTTVFVIDLRYRRDRHFFYEPQVLGKACT